MTTVITITGPSGAGKTVLSNTLKKDHGFSEIVSVTTRQPRKGEQNGIDYSFITVDQFKELEMNNKLVESINYDNKYYGVPAEEIIKASEEGRPAALVVEPNGVKQITEYCEKNNWNLIRVFVNNPLDILLERLLNRFVKDLEEIRDGETLFTAKQYDEKVKTYASRIQRVAGFEQENWVKPAYSQGADHTPYEIIINEFNEQNQAEIIQQIKNKVAEFNKKPAHKM